MEALQPALQQAVLSPKKDLKSLSDCESKATKNSGLNQAQVDDCYKQLFPRDQTLQSTPMQGQTKSSLEQQTGFSFK